MVTTTRRRQGRDGWPVSGRSSRRRWLAKAIRVRLSDSKPSGTNTIWPLPRRGCDRRHWCLMPAVPLDDHRLQRRVGRGSPGRGEDALPPPRVRRHPGAMGIWPPPTRPRPRFGPDRGAAPAGALPRVRSHPRPAACRVAATPGGLHRGDRHRTGPQGRRPGTPTDRRHAGPLTRPLSAAGCVPLAAVIISPSSGNAARRN